MDPLASVALIASCLLAAYVGTRTLLVWRRTRRVPELAIGTNVLSVAVGAALLTAVGTLGQSDGRDVPRLPMVLGLLGLAVHVVALYLAAWKIFRPESSWPALPLGVASILVSVWLVSFAMDPATRGERALLYHALRGVGLGWVAIECLRFSMMLRRRAALGLAEPILAHRVWLWGVSALASGGVVALEVASWIHLGSPLAASSAGLHAMAGLGLVGTVAIWLAFFPPAAYVRLASQGVRSRLA